MNNSITNEIMAERKVRYTLELGDRFIIIENVPAKVCPEPGHRFFSPDTVEKIQEIIRKEKKPERIIETPVYKFAA